MPSLPKKFSHWTLKSIRINLTAGECMIQWLYFFTLTLMSAWEGSCRMCPLTTMSSSSAPSESRPLAMWVIRRISPVQIKFISCSNNPTVFRQRPPTGDSVCLIACDGTVCFELYWDSHTCGKLHLCLSPEGASCQRVAVDSLPYFLCSRPVDGVQNWDELSHRRTLKISAREDLIALI